MRPAMTGICADQSLLIAAVDVTPPPPRIAG
jgi:hypothetical protein